MEDQSIRCSIILELLGKPKDHIEKTLKEYIEHIKKNEAIIVLKEEYAEAKEQESGMWSIFVELELVIKGLVPLFNFCFDYMPSSIEIIKPEKFELKNTELSSLTNDLQAKLHNVDMVAKKLRAENEFLRRNMKTMVKNAVAILLQLKKGRMDDLVLLTGVPKEELSIILEEMLKDNKIKKEGEEYILA